MISFDEVMKLTGTVSSATAFDDAECRALYDLCSALHSSSVVVEIGCQLGRTSSIIAQVGKSIGYHSVHIDPYTYQLEYLSGWIAMMHGIGQPFTFLCMRTDQAWRELEQYGQIDLLLIDGDHTTDGVQKDCERAMLVRRSGIMCAHDYDRPSLPDVRAVMDAFTLCLWEKIGVYSSLGVWRRC